MPLGIHAAHALHDFYCTDGGIRVLATSQLTFDLAEDIAQAQLVLFIDAAAIRISGRDLHGRSTSGRRKGAIHPSLDAPHLTDALQQLYGRAPTAMSLTMAMPRRAI